MNDFYKLRHYNTLNAFNRKLSEGSIKDSDVVFIKESKLIWTHGTFWCDLEEINKQIKQLTTDLGYLKEIYPENLFKSDSEIISLLKSGGEVTLAKDLNAPKDVTLTKDLELDLNNKTINAVGGTYGDNVVIGNGANVTISNGEIKPAETASVANASATIIVKTAYASSLTLENVKVSGIHPLYVNSANENTKVVINSGEFSTTMTGDPDKLAPVVYVGKGSTGSTTGGKVTINGGTFGTKGVVNNYLLNVEDVLRKLEGKEPRDFIEVFGGTFINFDPANNKAEGEGTNFVAEGYTTEVLIEMDDNDETNYIYTVVPKKNDGSSTDDDVDFDFS